MNGTCSAISLQFEDKDGKTIDVPLTGSDSSREILLECGHNYRVDTVGSLSKWSPIRKQDIPIYLSIGPGVESTGPSIQPTDHSDLTPIFGAHKMQIMRRDGVRGWVSTRYVPITISVPDDPRGYVKVVDKDGYQSEYAY
jgi:hypothetical protein